MLTVRDFQLKYSILLMTAEIPPRKTQPPNKCDINYHYSYNKKLEDCQCCSYRGGKDDNGDPGNYKHMTLT